MSLKPLVWPVRLHTQWLSTNPRAPPALWACICGLRPSRIPARCLPCKMKRKAKNATAQGCHLTALEKCWAQWPTPGSNCGGPTHPLVRWPAHTWSETALPYIAVACRSAQHVFFLRAKLPACESCHENRGVVVEAPFHGVASRGPW